MVFHFRIRRLDNMTPAKTRSSNIELLRILAMFMIIIFHISDHCVKVQLTDTASMLRMNNGLFCEPVFIRSSCFFPPLLQWEKSEMLFSLRFPDTLWFQRETELILPKFPKIAVTAWFCRSFPDTGIFLLVPHD